MHTRAWMIALVLGVGIGWGCRVPNKEHCANQDEPGNTYCAAKNPATPYCSPCTASYDGCVPFPPTACEEFATDEGSSSSAGTGESSTSG